MTDLAPTYEAPRRFHFQWLLPVLIGPRAFFTKLAEYANDAWLTPLGLLTIVVLTRVFLSAPLREAAAAQVVPPADFQYWTPEQQAQFMQAAQSTSGPVFIYVFPAVGALFGVWLMWALTFSILHFAITLLGGRSAMRGAMNLVAWASVPLLLREILRLGYVLMMQKLITTSGLAGFMPAGTDMVTVYVTQLLANVDAFFIWHVVLLVLGVMVADRLPLLKALTGVMLTIIILLTLQALPGFIGAQLGGLTVMRPFF